MLSMRKETLCLGNDLSEREKEVLTWVARGKTAWEVATILHLSRRTVEWYITQARLKLNAVSIVQAVVEAIKTNQIVPTFVSIGCGVAPAAAIWGVRLMQWMDWIGDPGGII